MKTKVTTYYIFKIKNKLRQKLAKLFSIFATESSKL